MPAIESVSLFSGPAMFRDSRLARVAGTARLVIASLALGLGACGGDSPVDPAVATSIVANSSASLTAVAGAAVTELPSVIVKDQRDAAMPGVSVTFTLIGGGGTIAGSLVTTNPSGIATVGSWTLGTVAGSNSLTASTSGLTAVTFTATGTAGAPASVAKTAGDAQNATAGSAVSVAPTVTVKDANGNPVSGVNVVFAVASGGGSVTGATVTTNVSGVATVGGWTLGTVAGSNSLTASASGLTAVTFTATGTTVAVATVTVIPATPNVVVGSTQQLTATTKDASGNILTGRTVTWSSSSTAVATVTGTGLVTAVAAGTATITATSEGKSGTSVVTVPAPSVVSLTATSAPYQVITVGTPVWSAPTVVLKDASGAPIKDGNVTFTVASGGGTVSGATVKTDATGIAQAGSWVLGPAPGENKLTAQVVGLTPIIFTAIGSESTDGKTDLLAGGAGFAGDWPPVARVAFEDGTGAVAVDAFPGQIQLFFVNGTTQADAQAVIRANNGVILSQLPVAGYYLIGVRAGLEAAFIKAVAGSASVLTVNPHVASYYGWRSRDLATAGAHISLGSAAEITDRAVFGTPASTLFDAPPIQIIDGCGHSHATGVEGSIQGYGGQLGECFDDSSPVDKHVSVPDKTVHHIIEVGVKDAGKGRLLNVSSYGGLYDPIVGDLYYPAADQDLKKLAQTNWLLLARMYVQAVAKLPLEARQNLVVGICSGNSAMPIGALITELRQDPSYATVLKENFLIVGTADPLARTNDAGGDPDFARMPDVDPCSFATPRALVIVQKLISTYGISAKEALAAAKKAIAANRDKMLIESEALGYAVPPPTIGTFEAITPSIVAGESSYLSWFLVTNASTCSIAGVGPVPVTVSCTGTTSLLVSPRETTIYTLTATGPGGSTTASTTVTVAGASRTYTLTVRRAGTGIGTVTSSPTGISCGDICSAEYENLTSVVLTATPRSSPSIAAFSGWGGACTGTGPCVLIIKSDTTVTASFLAPYDGKYRIGYTGTYSCTFEDGHVGTGLSFNDQALPIRIVDDVVMGDNWAGVQGTVTSSGAMNFTYDYFSEGHGWIFKGTIDRTGNSSGTWTATDDATDPPYCSWTARTWVGVPRSAP